MHGICKRMVRFSKFYALEHAEIWYSRCMKDLQKFALTHGYTLMRYSLATSFIWFGLLKIIDASPVKTTVFMAVPDSITAIPGFFLVLGLIEVIFGILLLLNKTVLYASIVLFLHLVIATVSVIVTQGFSPTFPYLTFEGEFVIKNLVLMAGLVSLLGHKSSKV